MTERKAEFYSVTSVRGLASLAVCWFHIGLWTQLLPDGIFRYSAGYGWLGPHIFFIVSGFVVPWSMYAARYRWQDAPRYIARRIVRLDPPYIIAIMVVLVLSYVGSKVGLTKEAFTFDWARVLSHLAYLTGILGEKWYSPIFWTLAIEFQYYLALAVFFPFIANRRPLVRRSAMTVCLLLFIPFAGLAQTVWLTGYLPLFMLGFVLFQFHSRIIDRRELVRWAALLILVASTYANVLSFMALLAFLVMYEDRFRNRVTEFLGRISYSLYLIHMPVGIPFVRLTQPYAANDFQLVALGLISVLFCIVCAWLFFLAVEQPSIRLAKSIRLHKTEVVSQKLGPNVIVPPEVITDQLQEQRY